MEKKIYEAIIAVDSLKRLSAYLFNNPLENRNFYKLIKRLEEEKDLYSDYQKRLMSNYGNEIENGFEIKFDSPNYPKYVKEMNEYENMEIDIDDNISLFKIPYSRINELNSLRPIDYDNFDKFGFIEFYDDVENQDNKEN